MTENKRKMPSTTTTFEKNIVENSILSNNFCSTCSISTTVVEKSAKKIKISNDVKLKNSDNNNDNNVDDDNNDEDIEICHHKIELVDDSNNNQILVDDNVEKNNSVEHSLEKFKSRIRMLEKEELLDIEALRVSVMVSSVFSAIEKDHLCRILNFKRGIYMILIYNCKNNIISQLDCKCMDFFNVPFCVCLETIGEFFKTLEIEIKECYTKERIKSFFFDRDSFQKEFIETAIQLGLLKKTIFYQTTTETNNNNNNDDDDNNIEPNNSLLITNSVSDLFENKNEIYLQRMKGYFELFPFFYREDIRKTIIESVEKEKAKSLINIVSSEELSCSQDTTTTTINEKYFADARYNVVLDIDGVLLVNVLGDNIDHGMYNNNYLGNINSKKCLQIFLLSSKQLITQRFAHGVFELLYYLWTNKNVKSIAIFSSGVEERNEVVADYIFSQMPPIRKKRDFVLRSRHHLFSKKSDLCTQKILSNYTPQPLLSSSVIKSTNSILSDLSGLEKKNYKHDDSSTLTSSSSFTSSSAVSITDNTITTIETETTTTETTTTTEITTDEITITATTEELCRKISERYSEIAKLGGNEFSSNNGFPKKQQEQFSTVMASNIYVKELSRNFPSFDLQNTILIDDQKDNSQIGETNNMIVVPNVENGSFVKHIHAETNSAMYICGIIDHLFKKAKENAKPLTDIIPTVESDVFNYDFYSQGLQILRKINPELEFLNQNNYEKQAKLFYLPTFINDNNNNIVVDNKITISTSSSTNQQTNNNTVSFDQNVLKIVENIVATSNNNNNDNNNDNNLTKTIQVM